MRSSGLPLDRPPFGDDSANPDLAAAEIHQDGGFQPLRPSDLETSPCRVSGLLFGRERAHCDLAGENRTRRTTPGRRQFIWIWMP
jgi:hypothetical protein